MSEFTDRVDAKIKECGIPKKKFYELTMIPSGTYYGWKKTGNLPRAEELKRIGEVLCVSIDWLLKGEEIALKYDNMSAEDLYKMLKRFLENTPLEEAHEIILFGASLAAQKHDMEKDEVLSIANDAVKLCTREKMLEFIVKNLQHADEALVNELVEFLQAKLFMQGKIGKDDLFQHSKYDTVKESDLEGLLLEYETFKANQEHNNGE